MLKSILLLIFGVVFLNAKINIVVSIPPEESFVKEIGKDKVNVEVMVKPGNSPHTYEPKPSQMREISNAKIYFAIGVEFEKAWLPRFANQNRNLKIIDISKGVKRYGKDPHIWTSPKNILLIGKNIEKSLIELDSKNLEFYEKNYKEFEKRVKDLQKRIKEILKDTKDAKFMVFHPSWGYFAKEFGLKQLPIEIEGKSPKPKELIKIMKIAKKSGIKVIVTSPEFSDKAARVIAKELKIRVIKISPLSQNLEQNLLLLARSIVGKE